jgi:hypothetical protein
MKCLEIQLKLMKTILPRIYQKPFFRIFRNPPKKYLYTGMHTVSLVTNSKDMSDVQSP